MGICKPEHINGTLAGLMAQALDRKDNEENKADKQISASVWNEFIDNIRRESGNDKLGKKIQNSISLEDAIKSITTYSCRAGKSKELTGTEMAREWVKDLGLDIKVKQSKPAAPAVKQPAAPAEKQSASPAAPADTAARDTLVPPVVTHPADTVARDTLVPPVVTQPADTAARDTLVPPVVTQPADTSARDTLVPPVVTHPADTVARDTLVQPPVEQPETPPEEVEEPEEIEFSKPSPYVSLEEHPEYLSAKSEPYPNSEKLLARKVDETKTKTRKRFFGLFGKKITKYDENGKKVSVEIQKNSGKRKYRYFDKYESLLYSVSYDAEGDVSYWYDYGLHSGMKNEPRASFYDNGRIKTIYEEKRGGKSVRDTYYSENSGAVYKINEYNPAEGISRKETKNDYGYITVTEYDPAEKPIKQTCYGATITVKEYTDGNKTKETVYHGESVDVSDYDISTGNMTKNTWYATDGSISIRDYNPSTGAKEKGTEIMADGSIIVKEYGEESNLIKQTSYNSDKNVTSYILYSYDEDSNLIKQTSYSSDESVTSYALYSYDEYGSHFKTTWYNSDDSVYYYEIRKSVIEYEIYNGNNEKVGTFNLEEDGEYYDNDGNKVESLEDLLK